MEVIGYQIFIISTILVTHFFKREWVLGLCIFWSIETVALVFFPPLIAIQLGVVWGTWYLLKNNTRHKDKIEELERFISAKPVEIQKLFRAVPEKDVNTLRGKQHIKFLEQTINDAKSTIVILSGWITKYVVTSQFVKLLENALDRGVNIYIGYGYRGSEPQHEEIKGSESDAIVSNLSSLKDKYRGNIYIAEFPTHEKVLIKDTDYVVCGSNNWLANRKFKNSERSFVVHSSDLVEREFLDISKTIIRNEI